MRTTPLPLAFAFQRGVGKSVQSVTLMSLADVSVLTESLPGSRVGLRIEAPSRQVDAAFERALDRLAHQVRIQGFRPGKAPRALVEARVGPDGLRQAVVDSLVIELVVTALRDNNIKPIDRPQVEIEELERGRPGRFTATVSVMPQVVLPDLSTLTVERPHTEVDDARVQSRLDEMRESLSEVEPVDREVRVSDIVVGDLKVFVDDREIVDEARAAIELEVKEGLLVPELVAALPGAKTGDVVKASVEMPDDHANPELKGQRARLEVTVQGVKEKRVPDLTDEVAKEVSNGQQETAEALREAVRHSMVEDAQQSDQRAFQSRAVQAVVEGAEIEVPDALVDIEVERELDRLNDVLKRQGLGLDRYLQYIGRTEQAYRAEMRPDALGRIKTDLVLDELGKAFAIEPSRQEVEAYVSSLAKDEPELTERVDELLGNEETFDRLRWRLIRHRTLEMLTARLGGEPETLQ
jgi:trigger factor